jgi:hypothetical protein
VQVEFGLQLSAEVGAFVGGASSTGNFKVSMTWHRRPGPSGPLVARSGGAGGAMPQHTYVDFALVEPGEDDGYRARVLNSPVGVTRPIPVALPFSDLELENFLLRIGRPRRQTTRGEGTPVAAAVREFGSRLFDAVFTDRVRRALTSSLDQVEGVSTGLARPGCGWADCPELAELPWEYLYDPDARRFLALSAVGRRSWRYLELPRRIRPLVVQLAPLRILLDGRQPHRLSPGSTSWRSGRRCATRCPTCRTPACRAPPGVPRGGWQTCGASLRRGDFHVFHFIGHGRYDPLDPGRRPRAGGPGRAGAALQRGRPRRPAVRSQEPATGGAQLVRGEPGVARTDPTPERRRAWSTSGIPAVVAMQFEITDDAAITFAHSLYEAVADGYHLDAAMAEARNAVRDEPNPVEWATPVLYLRAPDGRIFDLPARPAPSVPTGEEAVAEPVPADRPAVPPPRRDDAVARPPRDRVPPPTPRARPTQEPATGARHAAEPAAVHARPEPATGARPCRGAGRRRTPRAAVRRGPGRRAHLPPRACPRRTRVVSPAPAPASRPAPRTRHADAPVTADAVRRPATGPAGGGRGRPRRPGRGRGRRLPAPGGPRRRREPPTPTTSAPRHCCHRGLRCLEPPSSPRGPWDDETDLYSWTPAGASGSD